MFHSSGFLRTHRAEYGHDPAGFRRGTSSLQKRIQVNEINEINLPDNVTVVIRKSPQIFRSRKFGILVLNNRSLVVSTSDLLVTAKNLVFLRSKRTRSYLNQPFSSAYFINSALVRRFSLAVRLLRWYSTVLTLRLSISAVSRLVYPRAINFKTSISR